MTGLAFTPGLLGGAPPAATSPAHSAGVFSLGVASGDPLPDGVVLWTRLVRNPFARLGGMGSRPVRVEWEIAADESMTRVVRRGAAHATAEWGHSIHIDVRGLAPPAADYFYRFRLNADNAGNSKELLGPLSTGELRQRLEQERADTEQNVESLKIEVSSKISVVAVETVDTDTAKTVVMAEVTGRSVKLPPGGEPVSWCSGSI